MTKINYTIAHLLKTLFAKLLIDVVYLYGSRAKDVYDTLSDYDFGILFGKGLSQKERFDLRLRLFGDIAEKINHNEDNIDVVDLEEVPVLLQFNIINGKVIYNKNEERRIAIETYVMGRYADEHYYYDRYLTDTLDKIRKGVYFERRISYP